MEHYSASMTIEEDNMDREIKNDEDAKKFVDQYDYTGVYQSDYIFGEQVDVYKDIIGEKHTPEEMDQIIALAESDVEREYSNAIERDESNAIAANAIVTPHTVNNDASNPATLIVISIILAALVLLFVAPARRRWRK
ncbi:hypothetical protein [Cohnella faecalis]|uniref:hypothetical protein n=1 Tax=Cohnella faecalis TaxID=2315694 RepID=UPI0011C21B18|nr:hypothetical protein [Cohnella faecalis]